MNSLLFCLTAASSALLIPHASAQSIFTSNFETPDIPALNQVYAGDTLLEDWSVISGSVDLVDISNIWTSGPAFEGTQYVDLDGDGPGAMARTFSTTPGLSYIVTFAYANNYQNQPSAEALVRLYGNSGDRLTQTVNHATSQAGNLDWSQFSGEFTAGDDLTTLEFSSHSVGVAGGILLDAVSVQLIPEPSAAFLMTGALAAFSGRRNRRRH